MTVVSMKLVNSGNSAVDVLVHQIMICFAFVSVNVNVLVKMAKLLRNSRR